MSEPVAHIRRIIEIQAMKGDTYSGRWGFSVDFVPLLTGSGLRPKRTARSARFDLTIDPVDQSERGVPGWCSFQATASDEERARIGCAVAEAAAADFDTVADLSDLCAAFRKRSRMRFTRFGLGNYVQTELAWGLALIACGDDAEGREHLRSFCAAEQLPPDADALQRAMAIARGVAQTTAPGPAPAPRRRWWPGSGVG